MKTFETIARLPKHKQDALLELLTILQSLREIDGLLLGGSTTYKLEIEKSDIDLFCLVQNGSYLETTLPERLSCLENVDTMVHQGSYPWTGQLLTIYYKNDLDFSIDLCLVENNKADHFFWEPSGVILYERDDELTTLRRQQLSKHGDDWRPFLHDNPFTQAIVTLKKIEKNISRSHLWNAVEQTSILRRYIMQILRLDVLQDHNFLGRVDRNIEDILPGELNQRLIQTIAFYDKSDIAQKAMSLAAWLTELLTDSQCHPAQREWMNKQLEHEKNKLRKLTLCTVRNTSPL